jgi:hypothetical protein
MKLKNIAAVILLLTIISFSVNSCQSAKEKSVLETTQSTQKIPTSKELNADNFDDHFAVKITVTNYHETVKSKIFYDCSCYLNVEIEKKSNIEIVDDIPVNLHVFANEWSVYNMGHQRYLEDGEYYSTIELEVPQSGYFYQTFKCTRFDVGSKAGELPRAKIGSVNPPPVIYATLPSFE